jgi:hypothetical protein
MARIDPKNDELGMMENIFRGVRSITSGPKHQEKDGQAAPAAPNASQEVAEPNQPQEMQSASTEGAPSHTDPSDTTQQEPQS